MRGKEGAQPHRRLVRERERVLQRGDDAYVDLERQLMAALARD
jgi:hypothetical protein